MERTMKLVSTDIREGSIELTYADNPDLDDAERLLIVRLPREVDQSKSLAWNRYWALTDLQELVTEQIKVERNVSEGRA